MKVGADAIVAAVRSSKTWSWLMGCWKLVAVAIVSSSKEGGCSQKREEDGCRWCSCSRGGGGDINHRRRAVG